MYVNTYKYLVKYQSVYHQLIWKNYSTEIYCTLLHCNFHMNEG